MKWLGWHVSESCKGADESSRCWSTTAALGEKDLDLQHFIPLIFFFFAKNKTQWSLSHKLGLFSSLPPVPVRSSPYNVVLSFVDTTREHFGLIWQLFLLLFSLSVFLSLASFLCTFKPKIWGRRESRLHFERTWMSFGLWAQTALSHFCICTLVVRTLSGNNPN